MIKPITSLLAGNGLAAKAIRFAIVGGVSTLAHGLLTHVAVRHWDVPPTLATVVGYLLAVPLNFLLQRTFTFRSKQSLHHEVPRYLLVHGLNIACSFLLMLAVADVLGADYRWGILATAVLVPVVTFIAMNLWVFRHRPAGCS